MVFQRIFFSLIAIWLLSLSSLSWAKPTVFVESDWVYQHQDKIKLIDLSSKLDYQRFHLPNAIWVDYAWLIQPQEGLELSGGEAYMTQLLSKLGIKNSDHLVIYDNLGGLDASRFYWEMAKLNHSKISILDGGSVDWVLKGYPVTQAVPSIIPAYYFPPKTTLTHAFTADKQEVLAAISHPRIKLLDIRTQKEYLGQDRKTRGGHIPTGRLLPWQSMIDLDKGFRQVSDPELEALFKEAGLQSRQDEIILYCNTAHRAARVWSALQSLGYHKVKLYDASLQEWRIDPDLPLKTGIQP